MGGGLTEVLGGRVPTCKRRRRVSWRGLHALSSRGTGERGLAGLKAVAKCSRTVWAAQGAFALVSLTPFVCPLLSSSMCCHPHFPSFPYPHRVIIRGGKAAASQDLMGQLGVISKVEHSTSAVEVQLPKLGEGEGEKGGGKGTTGIGCSSKFTCGSGMQA